MNDDTIAHQTRLVCTVNFSFDDHGTSHCTNLGNLVNLAHLDLGCHLFLDNLIEHTLHSGTYIVDGIINNGVGIDFYAITLCQFTCIGRGAHLETNNDSIRSRSQHDIVF